MNRNTIRIKIVWIRTKTTPCTNSYYTICITIVWIRLYEFVQKLAKKIVSRLWFQPGTNIALAIVAVSTIHHPASPVSGHLVIYRKIKKTIRKTRLCKFIRVAYTFTSLVSHLSPTKRLVPVSTWIPDSISWPTADKQAFMLNTMMVCCSTTLSHPHPFASHCPTPPPPHQQPQHTVSWRWMARFGQSHCQWLAPDPFWNAAKLLILLLQCLPPARRQTIGFLVPETALRVIYFALLSF